MRVDKFDSIVLRVAVVSEKRVRDEEGEGGGGLTRSGLCEAVTMTPIAFPPRFLLLRAASRPTL